MAKLKVYRTAIGFDDAYVAAPSKKAALAAWGSTRDLFARGMAELVDDPALCAAPLADPGTVVRRSRGTRDEQIAALPKTKASRARPADAEDDAAPRVAKRKAAKPPPDRGALDKAEAAFAATESAHAVAAEALQTKIRTLEAQYRALRKRQATELAALEEVRAAADAAYREAVARAG
ncbi:hypothetical protein [Sphingomonas montana]|uniref:hypothetical protein n=1 Tax=Sphingomonas montana TaxID=1843236 RepID=UPI00096CD2B8|nr:hypothetical protein [Sphingomonas montana]